MWYSEPKQGTRQLLTPRPDPDPYVAPPDAPDPPVDGELLTNTAFADTTGLLSYNAVLSVANGELSVADAGAYSRGYETLTLSTDEVYLFKADGMGVNDIVNAGNNNFNGQLLALDGSAALNSSGVTEAVCNEAHVSVADVWESLVVPFKPKSATTHLIYHSNGAETAKYRNPSVKVLGTEILVNKDFNDTTGLTAYNATMAAANNELTVGDAGGYSRVYEDVTLEPGATYVFHADCYNIDNYMGDITVLRQADSIETPSANAIGTSKGGQQNIWERLTITFVAPEANIRVCYSSGSSYSSKFRRPFLRKLP